MADEGADQSQEKKEQQAEVVYECAICEKTYGGPGMCQACHVLLKPRGE